MAHGAGTKWARPARGEPVKPCSRRWARVPDLTLLIPDGAEPKVSDILLDIGADGVAILTLNRPDKRNVVRHAMWHELKALATKLGADPNVRAVVLTGAGEHFCAGADISEFQDLRKDVATTSRFEADIEAGEDALMALGKPTIAAVTGYCLGAGCALILCCDLRIAHTSARFGIPASKLGIVYSLRDTRALYNAVGLANAKRILYSGDQIDASQAYRMGLADEVVAGDALAEAKALAARFAANAPLSIAGSKVILNALAEGSAEQQARDIRALQDIAHTSEDHLEAVHAFMNKRRPTFKGR